MTNPFFVNHGPFKINEILGFISLNSNEPNDHEIHDVKDLVTSTEKDLTFFHNKNYAVLASKTKASYCLTLNNLISHLPSSCKPIIVDNVLLSIAEITKKFYPSSITDDFDNEVIEIENTDLKEKVKFGKNVYIGKNVNIGKNCKIGHNSIIESNVIIGENCSIGSNVILRNSLLKNNVSILDGAIIGKKGFGFFPNKENNIRYPHIGIVIIEDNCEIGCGATIDRGSMSNTIIGKNTYIDNQVHIAHNNKIGNNVHIGGGSGVINDIPDNSRIMGYPATNLRNFLKGKK